MPFLGLYPFLPLSEAYVDLYKMCQCPFSGFIHFYVTLMNNSVQILYVSMPFLGLYPFLHHCRTMVAAKWFVSMPFLGLYPFLQLATLITSSIVLHCVNALSRALSISTLTSANPLFIEAQFSNN